MGRGTLTFVVFVATTALVAAFHGIFFLVADSIPGQFWLIPLALILPIVPLQNLLETAFDIQGNVRLITESSLSALFWGIVAGAVTFISRSPRRRRTPTIA